jgi:hypothetical protein
VAVPGALLVAAQVWFTFRTTTMAPAEVVLAPLSVVFLYTRRSVPMVAVKLVLSVVFPLAVALGFRREAWRDVPLRLAWLAFLAGTAYAYGLAETGPRRVHGNFLWSAQVANLVLFAASVRFALARAGDAEPRRGRTAVLALCAVAFALHVASGASNLARFVRTGPRYFDSRAGGTIPACAPCGPRPSPAGSASSCSWPVPWA